MRFGLRMVLAYLTMWLKLLCAKIGIRSVPEAVIDKKNSTLTMYYYMGGKVYSHRVNYSMDNMDDYDGEKGVNLYVKRDMLAK